MIHELKILPPHYGPVSRRLKTAELRKNDRNYEIGDHLHLMEWGGTDYTGRRIMAVVRHVADVGALAPGYVLLSIEVVK